MSIEEFRYDNLNKHFLSDNALSSSSEGKYEKMNLEEMVANLKSKKVKAIKSTELGYKAIRGDNISISNEFLVILKDTPISLKTADTTEKRMLAENQLKFHISLPEDKYAEGWDIVMPILIENGIAQFKIPHEGKYMSSAEGQYGKDITIYADKNPDKGIAEWQEILTAITEALVAANIPPGYKTARTGAESERYDIGITGSKYISYRYDIKNPPSVNEDPCTQLTISNHQPHDPQIFGQNNDTNESCCPKCNII